MSDLGSSVASIASVTLLMLSVIAWWRLALLGRRFWGWRLLQSIERRPASLLGLFDVLALIFIIGLLEATLIGQAAPSSPVTKTTAQATQETEQVAGAQSLGESSADTPDVLPPLTPEQQAASLWRVGLSRFLAIPLFLLWLGLRYRPSFKELGCRVADMGPACLLGLLASVMLLPPLLLLQQLLSRFITYRHSTLDAMSEHPSIAIFLAAFFSAGLAAPLFEELFFRFTIQGWLRRLLQIFFGMLREPDWGMRSLEWIFVGGRFPPTPAAGTGTGHHNDSGVTTFTASFPADELDGPRRLAFWLPLFATSTLFALAHIGQGPAPIPLFFLAMGLGWLYARTGNLVPAIVVHGALNLWSLSLLMWMTWSSAA